MTKNDFATLAADFWEKSGLEYNPPCNIVEATRRATPLAIIPLPALCTSILQNWLGKRSIFISPIYKNRPLHACLVSRKGAGLLFFNSDDSPEEQRFSIAHEVAHFILDYLLPRERAVASMGEKILPVLDGEREATPDERFDALWGDVCLGTYNHLFVRGEGGGFLHYSAKRSEIEADNLALEIVAPTKLLSPFSINHVPMVAQKFGIPAHIVSAFFSSRSIKKMKQQRFRDWIGF
ncbi:ImmA/IrrE family metallo-endopeptidase [uncultured Desulfovibrio sp.]|uniref:ImmA/IrrE family metallo-endopeptidase n=1 Tax=uncultured Desulfovibrio sp. TaxID=167968 RepID=UPI0028043540|nr:ImmA/IrrE family metallo-endopeptidase [uncultured Desulfovibrio sp.]